MMLQIEFWQLAGMAAALLATTVGAFWVLGQVLVKQYDRMLTERFKARDEGDKNREQTHTTALAGIQSRLDKLEAQQREELDELRRVDDRISSESREADQRIESRINDIDSRVAAAPTKDDITRLHGRIDEVAQDIAGLRGAFQAAADTLNLIHRKLLGG